MAVYAGMVQSLDRGVGKILDDLTKRGLDRNTLVIFLSDKRRLPGNVQPGWYDIPSTTRDGRPIAVGNKSADMPGPQTVYQSYGRRGPTPRTRRSANSSISPRKAASRPPSSSAGPGATGQPGRIEHDQVGHVIDLMPTTLQAAGVQTPKPGTIDLFPPRRGSACCRRSPAARRSHAAPSAGNTKGIGPSAWAIGNSSPRTASNGNCSTWWPTAPNCTMPPADHPAEVKALHEAYDAWVKRVGVEEWPIRD